MRFSLFLYVFLYCYLSAYSQDSARMKQIDSLVKLINASDFTVHYDTIRLDRPESGLFVRTYLTMVTNGSELKKYVNFVDGAMRENGAMKQMISSSSFYFNQSKLIKVEEFGMEGDKKMEALWYYADDKPLYYSFKSEKSEARAELLLTMAEDMLARIRFNPRDSIALLAESWQKLKTEIQRRTDIINNLLSVISKSGRVDKDKIEKVKSSTRDLNLLIASSNDHDSITVQHAYQKNEILTMEFSKLLALLIEDPKIKFADEMKGLQTQLEGSENRLLFAKRKYNEACVTFKRPDLLFGNTRK